MDTFRNIVLVPPDLNLRDAFLLVVTGALVTHTIYKKYEVKPTNYAPTFLLLVAIPYICSFALVPHFTAPAFSYISGFVTFHVSLLSSIALYRLSPWHPLAKYPGPSLAKLHKFWMIYIILTRDQKRKIMDLHKKYGPYVRIGPNEVSFVDVDLLPAILAPDMPKGPVFDGRRHPDAPASLLQTRCSKEHAEKRTVWARAFSVASIHEYQPLLARRALQLVTELEKCSVAGDHVNLTQWFTHFAFDFMGDMAFGGGFELMRDRDASGIRNQLDARKDAVGWQMHLPWATRLFLKIPYLSGSVVKFRNLAIQCTTKRLQDGSRTKDLFYHFNNEASQQNQPPEPDELIANGELAILAGSDTTSATLSGIFYYLLTHPDCYVHLQAEIDREFPPREGDPFDAVRLAEMKYLNAIINETLRLQPPVPTFLHRAPEKGTNGKWIGEHFIDESTAVYVPPYVYHRDPRYFWPRPDDFWPDRWLQSDEPSLKDSVIMNSAAFIPFSAGNRNCAGKNLALLELRLIVALLVQRFDMRLEDGYHPCQYEDGVVDMTLTKVGELFVILRPRL